MVGERLKTLRVGIEMDQKALSKALGVTQGALSFYENDKRELGAQMIVKIMNITNCNPAWLLTGKGSMFVDNDDKDDEQIAALKDEIAKLQAENNKLNKELLQTLKELCRFQRKELQQK